MALAAIGVLAHAVTPEPVDVDVEVEEPLVDVGGELEPVVEELQPPRATKPTAASTAMNRRRTAVMQNPISTSADRFGCSGAGDTDIGYPALDQLPQDLRDTWT
jgi:hypothetical protein